MGGIDGKGTIVSGSKDEIKRVVKEVLNTGPEEFILGGDFTIPSEIN